MVKASLIFLGVVLTLLSVIRFIVFAQTMTSSPSPSPKMTTTPTPSVRVPTEAPTTGRVN